MFTLSLRKAAVAATIAIALGAGLAATPASADPWGQHAWHGGGWNGGGWHRGWGGGPRFGFAFAPPVYGGYGYDDGDYAPRCFVRTRVVPGPWGWHRVSRRVCR